MKFYPEVFSLGLSFSSCVKNMLSRLLVTSAAFSSGLRLFLVIV